MVRRTTAAAITALLLWSAGAAAQVGAPAPPIEQGLLDCSLYRYGDRFDAAIAATMTRIAAATATDTRLAAAFGGSTRVDVTETLYRLGVLRRVTDCTQPVLRGFAQNGAVALQIGALQSPVCEQLVTSGTLRLQGLLVEPLHAPSGEARCGIGRNQVPNALTLFGLTRASRMLPGENTVTVTARGPFAAAPPQRPRAVPPAECPSVDGRPDPVIEAMITKGEHVEFDLPREWQVEPCFDALGGSSSTGMVCPVANWNNYHERLYDEFGRILARAAPSNDPGRIFSAAYWLISKSDPLRLTIRSFDYEQRECDVIRNRVVVAWGKCEWDGLVAGMKLVSPTVLQNGRQAILDEVAKASAQCVKQIPRNYGPANELIDKVMRPLPFPEKRFRILELVQQRVHDAMANSGYGSCDYYADAVMRLDQAVWKNQYASGAAQIPIDWEHNFWKSAARCLSGR